MIDFDRFTHPPFLGGVKFQMIHGSLMLVLGSDGFLFSHSGFGPNRRSWYPGTPQHYVS